MLLENLYWYLMHYYYFRFVLISQRLIVYFRICFRGFNSKLPRLDHQEHDTKEVLQNKDDRVLVLHLNVLLDPFLIKIKQNLTPFNLIFPNIFSKWFQVRYYREITFLEILDFW
jgi:hypothetical protein